MLGASVGCSAAADVAPAMSVGPGATSSAVTSSTATSSTGPASTSACSITASVVVSSSSGNVVDEPVPLRLVIELEEAPRLDADPRSGIGACAGDTIERRRGRADPLPAS